MDREQVFWRTLGQVCPSRLRDADGVVGEMLEFVRPWVGFAGCFLLDVEEGAYRRWQASNWPAELDSLCFRPGDQVLALLRSGPLFQADLAAHGLPSRLGALAALGDEQGAVRGLLAGGPPVGDGAGERLAGLAALLAGLLRLGELPREKEALRRYYGTVLENLHEAVVLGDVDGLILHWNQGAEELLGYRAEEVVSRGGNFLIPERELDQARALRRQVADGATLRDMACGRMARNGRVREVLLTMLPVRDRDGVVIGVAELMRLPHGDRVREARLEAESAAEEADAPPPGSITGLVGAHPALSRLRQLVQRIAPMDSAALILGESGTGKELVARAIHAQSGRASRPFVAVNCAAIPPSLLESELFGYEQGAFTGAARRHRGLLEQADGGTVLLDEVAELPAETQVKLLRVLQEKTIRRLGGSREIGLDVRFVACTNRPIRRYVDKGRFREDLYYRLNVVTLSLPPLRERLSDIPLLGRHGLREIATRHDHGLKRLDAEAVQALMEHTWPGNVRELFNVLERACVASRGRTISAADVRASLPELAPVLRQVYDGDVRLSLEEVERRHLGNVLAEVGGNVKAAAAILGISRETVYRKMEKYGLRR